MRFLRVTSFLAVATLVGILGAPVMAAAPKPVEAEVTTLRARATKLAQAGKWDLAIHTLSLAREKIQDARRDALRKSGTTSTNPKLHQEMKGLQTWYVGQLKLVAAGKRDRQSVIREFKSRQETLLRKYPRKPTVNPAASTAKLDLLLASINDTAAQYNSKRGKPRAAASQRQSALIGRLHALKAQGQTAQAGLVADKLLKEAPHDPDAVTEAGQFYQERKQFGRAAKIWEGGIQSLEGGQAKVRGVGVRHDRTQTRKRYLSQFYRQVAFCYSQLGRGADAKAAMAKAAQAEATLVPGTARR